MEDFCVVEFQTNGTTGTPWEGVTDLKNYGSYKKDSYKYGFNKANQYQKTMMQQVYKKGIITESWEKHMIFLLQDRGMDYLKKSKVSDMSSLIENKSMNLDQNNKFIHFATFTMKWDEVAWNPEITMIEDASSSDVVKMLGANEVEPGDLENFTEHLREILPSSKVI